MKQAFMVINFYEEEINGLVFYLKFEDKNKKMTYEDYENFLISKLAKTFSQDIITFLNVYQLEYKELVEKINNYYNKLIHSNLRNYLINVEETKNVIYTFTSIVKKINLKFEITNSKFGKIKGEDIKQIIVKNIKSERTLEKVLEDFYYNNQIVLI